MYIYVETSFCLKNVEVKPTDGNAFLLLMQKRVEIVHHPPFGTNGALKHIYPCGIPAPIAYFQSCRVMHWMCNTDKSEVYIFRRFWIEEKFHGSRAVIGLPLGAVSSKLGTGPESHHKGQGPSLIG